MAAVRTLVVWCPDWPVVAAVRAGDAPHDVPVAIFRANRVIAASASARAEGVRRAMRRREAQSRCPDVEIIDDDPARDVRLFEPVAAMVDAFTPRVEIVRAGQLQFATRGPSRYFGGDAALGATIAEAVAALDPGQPLDVRIGIADGPFTAALAARTALPGGVRVVEAGDTPTFLQGYPIDALVAVEGGRAVTRAARGGTKATTSKASHPSEVHGMALVELVGLLHRLGIHTLADLAALPADDVLARFGAVGAHAWTIATGVDVRPLRPRTPPPELVVATECDPPLERVDTAAFVARGLADELCARFATHGVACTCVLIEARVDDGTPGGRVVGRRWRHDGTGTSGGLTPQALGERVRWQLDGWLRGASAVGLSDRLTGGISHLRLVPEEIVADAGRQLALWGGASAADERASRAFARVQGLLGPDAVCRPVRTGGRRPAELVALVPWGDARDVAAAATADRPWPGALPAPRPTVVHDLPIPTEVCGPLGATLRVNRRGMLDDDPSTVVLAGRAVAVTAWAGPWPLEERWWDVQQARRQARLQLLTETGRAVLAVCEGGSWWLEAAWE
jgi:protein ImuB